jgi:hypothetical protein
VSDFHGADSAPEAVEVLIDNIVRSPKYQVRQGLHHPTVMRYAAILRSGKTLPPIQLARVNKALVCVDGFHRIAAHEHVAAKRKKAPGSIWAVVTDCTAKEALWLAAKANLEHGLPLKPKELRTVFRKYIQAGNHVEAKGRLKSYRAIASDLGGVKSHQTIANWMRRDFPKIAQRMSVIEPTAPKDDEAGDVASHFLSLAMEAIAQARAAAGGVSDQREREYLRALARDLLEHIEKNPDWKPEPSDF